MIGLTQAELVEAGFDKLSLRKALSELVCGENDLMAVELQQLRIPHTGDPAVSGKAAMPADSAWLFPEYDADEMDLVQYRGVIIERILERGSQDQLRWLFRTYGEATIAAWVRRHGFRLLSKRSFALWRLALNVQGIDTPEWAVAAKAESPW